MHTLNKRQLRALSIVAPGTLALHDSSTFALQTWLCTVEDADRTGFWAVTVDQDANVRYHMNGGGFETESYAKLIARDAEARLEALGLYD